MVASANDQNMLDGVTLEVPLNLSETGSIVHIKSGLILNSTIALEGQDSHLVFDPTTSGNISLSTTAGTGRLAFDVTAPGGSSLASAHLNVEGGTTLTVGPNVTIDGRSGVIGGTYSVAGPSTIVNLGQILGDLSVSPPGAVAAALQIQADSFTNDGTVEASNAGAVVFSSGVLTNFASGVLTGGTYEAAGNSLIGGFSGGIVTDAAAIILDGAGSAFLTGGAGTGDALASFTTISPAGRLAIQNGRNFNAMPGFSNGGKLTIGSGTTFTEAGSFAQSVATGVTEVDGILAPGGGSATSSGTLEGTGTIDANVTNAGVVAPGNSAGILTIAGNYIQTSSGVLDIELAGTNASLPSFDQLHVAGSATLSGTLSIVKINGFTPALGNSFQVITFASRAGDFTNHQGLVINNSVALRPVYDASSLTLVTVAPPQVQGVVINDGNSQRSTVDSITITFSTIVTLDSGAIEVDKRGGGAEGVTLANSIDGSGHTVVTITFAGADIIGHSLADGRYSLLIHANKVHDASDGQSLDGTGAGAAGTDFAQQFFRLFGDANGDGKVDNLDLAYFRSTASKHSGQAGYLWFMDYNNDGVVDTTTDYAQWLKRYGTSI